ncbi:hypothetical protein U879_08780 [Defluviimonas sp. 20V17]|uniref:Uncharacterized protein n=1 Tax=Allgaiera indica TaxID=765699 RepID=A0AAN5A1I7_9RHOB|nr:hypothetical protein [Allgaiera indica]KDB04061.1 hypothetical protein U879_08780 [Defluviimonas sp. 20V17]GHE06616.1 hypothetical protein GCM10008024_41360 [Allgaiera indica]SDX98083.1 hypothetical protein SAMN05444006_1611 [Allgaiera indica]
MKPLSDLPIELKALNTAALVFLGLAISMALAYIDVSHRGIGGSYLITPADIAATYYGPGVGVATLISLAHIHMLGLFSVFWIVSFIFIHCSFSAGWKAFWAVLPFIGFFVDVCGWFLSKMNPGFVYVVIFGGAMFVLSIAVMALVSLYEMWFTRDPRQRILNRNGFAGGSNS